MNDYQIQMLDATKSMLHAFLDEEISKAKDLSGRTEELTYELFQPNVDIQFVESKLNVLLKNMLEFEKDIINFEILHFLYADIGRISLNLHSFDMAIRYALAGININEVSNDYEGVLANKRLLLDSACFMGAYKNALILLEATPELYSNGLYQMISLKAVNQEVEQNFETLLHSKERPKSLIFCLDEDKRDEEGAIRSLMKQMGDSRATVLKYLAAAK